MSDKLILVIDMQNDFVTGPLGNDRAKGIIPGIKKLLKDNSDAKIIFTQDNHSNDYDGTLEGECIPVKHCISGTNGWEIVPELEEFTKNAGIIRKPTFGADFSDNDFSDYDEIILVGVCTDICVISNAIILRALYPDTKIIIYENLTAGATIENEEATFKVAESNLIEVKWYD